MTNLPPLSEMIDGAKFIAAPAAGAAVAVCTAVGVLAWLASRKLSFNWRLVAPPAAALAVAAALLAGNQSMEVFPKPADGRWWEWGAWPGSTAKPWHWAWWAFALALLAEVLARLPGVAPAAGNLFRGTAAGVLAAVVLPDFVAKDARWALPAFAGAVAVQWAVVDAVGRRSPGGWVAAAVTAAAGGAAAVLLHAESAGFMNVAAFLAAAVGVVVALAWLTGADGGAAGAAAVPPLAAVLLLGRFLRDSDVPHASFLAVGFAPLAMGLFLLPGVARLNGTRGGGLLKLVVVLLPVAYAVYRAATEAPYTFGATDDFG